MNFEHQYLKLVNQCLNQGVSRTSRSGIDKNSIFGVQMKVNLEEGFPLLTTRNISFRTVVYELLWILGSNTKIQFLKDKKINIWNDFANKEGE